MATATFYTLAHSDSRLIERALKNNMADSTLHKRSDGDTSSDVDLDLADLSLGICVRKDKYAKVHTVVSSEWTSAQLEAHVFEMRGKKVRFFERMVWPKMRKSNNYKADFIRASTRIFFYQVPEDVGPTKSSRRKTKKPRADVPNVTLAFPDAEESGDEKPTNLLKEARPDPVAFVKQVFICYCVRMSEPTPRFEEEQVNTDLPISAQPDGAPGDDFENMWEDVKRDARDLVDERQGDDTMPAEDDDQNSPLAATDGRKRPCGRSIRPLPQDRDLEMVLNLAEMINAEPIHHFPDGCWQAGRSFFSKHLCLPTGQPEDSTFEELALKQND